MEIASIVPSLPWCRAICPNQYSLEIGILPTVYSHFLSLCLCPCVSARAQKVITWGRKGFERTLSAKKTRCPRCTCWLSCLGLGHQHMHAYNESVTQWGNLSWSTIAVLRVPTLIAGKQCLITALTAVPPPLKTWRWKTAKLHNASTQTWAVSIHSMLIPTNCWSHFHFHMVTMKHKRGSPTWYWALLNVGWRVFALVDGWFNCGPHWPNSREILCVCVSVWVCERTLGSDSRYLRPTDTHLAFHQPSNNHPCGMLRNVTSRCWQMCTNAARTVRLQRQPLPHEFPAIPGFVFEISFLCCCSHAHTHTD